MLTSLKAASSASVSAASFEELGGGVSEILELFAEQGQENETETQLVRLVSKSGYEEWKSSVPEEKQLTFKEVGIDLSKWPGGGKVFPNIDNSMFALYDDSVAPSKISFQSLWPAVMKTKKKFMKFSMHNGDAVPQDVANRLAYAWTSHNYKAKAQRLNQSCAPRKKYYSRV